MKWTKVQDSKSWDLDPDVHVTQLHAYNHMLKKFTRVGRWSSLHYGTAIRREIERQERRMRIIDHLAEALVILVVAGLIIVLFVI